MTLAQVAATALGLFLWAGFNSTSTTSAQENVTEPRDGKKATAEMLAISLDLKMAGNFAIFADRGISDAGNSKIKGNVGVAGKDAEVSLNRASVQGNTYNGQDGQDVDTLRAQKDLAASFNAYNEPQKLDQ